MICASPSTSNRVASLRMNGSTPTHRPRPKSLPATTPSAIAERPAAHATMIVVTTAERTVRCWCALLASYSPGRGWNGGRGEKVMWVAGLRHGFRGPYDPDHINSLRRCSLSQRGTQELPAGWILESTVALSCGGITKSCAHGAVRRGA